MSQIGGSPAGRPRGQAPSNVYTVLALIALVALVFGIAVIWAYSHRLFGTAHPFEVLEIARLRIG